MLIRLLGSEDVGPYTALLPDGVEKHARCFRISPRDVAAAPVPFPAKSDQDFTLGAFSEAGALVGAVSFLREKSEKLRHKGLLYRVYVSDEAAGRGLGRRLVREVVPYASNQPGLEQINLTVVAENVRAKRLYASEGFVAFSVETRAIKAGGSISTRSRWHCASKPPLSDPVRASPGGAWAWRQSRRTVRRCWGCRAGPF